MRALARRHPVAAFLILVYASSAGTFAIPLLSTDGLGLIDLDLPGVAPFLLLSALVLAASAFIVTALADGSSGVRELRRRVFHLRVNPGWYVVALFLLPATGVATAAVLGGLGAIVELVGHPDFILGTVVVEALVAFVLVNWWEETGWTGFALHRLQPRMGPIAASVVTTWLQAIVHLPLVFVAGGLTDGRVPPDQVPFYLAALFILPISVRIVITWLYNVTGHSLPIVGLFHASMGVTTGDDFVPALAPGVDAVWVYAGFAVLALFVLVATRGRLGYVARGAGSIEAGGWRARPAGG